MALFYCIDKFPCIKNFFPAFTINIESEERVYGTFNMQSSPGRGSIIILLPAVIVEGGISLLLQLMGSSQFPLPVNVYTVVASGEIKDLILNDLNF